jgi:hypothetical protein
VAHPVRHLSETGPGAARRLCGARGGEAYHAGYLPKASIAAGEHAGETLCPACCEVWFTDGDDGWVPEWMFPDQP